MMASTAWTFDADDGISAWVEAARPVAFRAMEDPANSKWWRAGGTWFVGVDALPNDASGRVDAGPAPAGAAISAARSISAAPFHPLQISVMRPGYPGTGLGEDPAQHRFRLRRDGAHLDGLLPVGPDRRRHLQEPHAFILGVALTDASAEASPLVVWDGSERVIRRAFEEAFKGHDPGDWASIDVTDIYAIARREVFETCPRIPVPLQRGEAVLLHRMAIHGVAPWGGAATAEPQGRVIAYFRPLTDPERWFAKP